MCGRTACTLSPHCIKQVCSRRVVKDGKEVQIMPVWFNDPGGHKYFSSFNLPPTKYSPVLISSMHEHLHQLDLSSKSSKENEIVIQPMLWGLIPSWHTGDAGSFKLKLNNARSDGLLNKTSFKIPLQQGRRCVVICDGFYEWQSKDRNKLPYFIYFSENSDVYKSLKAEDFKHSSQEFIDESVKNETQDVESAGASAEDQTATKDFSINEYQESDHGAFLPKKLLTMAGVFDISKSKTGKTTFSYAIITVDAHRDYQFIHHRMPAVLNNEKEIDDWLNFSAVPLDQAMQLIRPTNELSFHPVSTIVNNSRHDNPQCILLDEHKEIKVVKKTKPLSKSASFMLSWLGDKRRGGGNDDDDTNSLSKKSKII